MALNRLDEHDGAALVEQLAGNAGLARETFDEIVERADGVPLFVEELTKAVLESDERDNQVAAVLAASPSPGRAIPATLHASLLARLDRLGAASKRVAQIGAAIGREFSHELLAIVAQGSGASSTAELRRLSDAGLMFCRGTPPEAMYTFKHALVQDAAYSTLLRRDRQQLHQSIAEVVEQHFPERSAREPELLAFHFAEAGQTARAIDYWLQAGERDIGRSANLEAIRHLNRGLDALRTLPESAERDRSELAFQIAIGGPLIAAHGYSAPQTGAAYKRARVLCERLGEIEPLVDTRRLPQDALADRRGKTVGMQNGFQRRFFEMIRKRRRLPNSISRGNGRIRGTHREQKRLPLSQRGVYPSRWPLLSY